MEQHKLLPMEDTGQAAVYLLYYRFYIAIHENYQLQAVPRLPVPY